MFYDACLAPSGLRATQFAMMSALERSGDLSVQALALLLDMDRSTAGQNVKLLERDGVIEIGRSARDGRARVIRLTMTGVERLAAARPLWQQAQSGIETVNGPAITAQMRAMLKDLALPA